MGNLRFTGFIAWLMWLAVHIVYITGFKNRLTTAFRWVISFLGRDRSERTSTIQQVFAREALQRLEGGHNALVWAPLGEHNIDTAAAAEVKLEELDSQAAQSVETAS